MCNYLGARAWAFWLRAQQYQTMWHCLDALLSRLTCDAFGVLPPVSKLTPSQAMYLSPGGLEMSWVLWGETMLREKCDLEVPWHTIRIHEVPNSLLNPSKVSLHLWLHSESGGYRGRTLRTTITLQYIIWYYRKQHDQQEIAWQWCSGRIWTVRCDHCRWECQSPLPPSQHASGHRSWCGTLPSMRNCWQRRRWAAKLEMGHGWLLQIIW